MGSWSLERLTTHSTPMNAPYFGTNYHAIFHLIYKPTTFGSYQELPKLDWHETIMMNDYQTNQCWIFATNMYEHNPCSATLLVWARRYIEAYRFVANLGSGLQKGKVELKAANGGPIPIQALGANIVGQAQQADAVRSYLRRNGGRLIIEIHDIPGINIPAAGQHKERLLLFDIGVTGLPLRSKAEQYLNVQFGVPPGNWGREFSNNGWPRARLNTTGLTSVQPPPGVANPRPPIFGQGECW